jgi:hypothetical protein
MGMVFNTQQTMQLIRAANGALVLGGFTSAAADTVLKGNLANVGSTTNLNDHVWNHLHLANAGVPNRLKFWFVKVLGSAPQGGHMVDYWVAQYILSALSNTAKYSGIEFFVVPDGATISVTQNDFADINNRGGTYTSVITIHTDAVDKYPGHPAPGT